MGGEEELLVGIEAHGLGDDAELHRFQILRTFRDDHDVGAVLALYRFPESSCRQQLVVDDQTVVVDEQDVDARFHIAVLEGIVEEDDIDVLDVISAGQLIDATSTFLVHGHGDVGKLGLHLVRFVADGADGRIVTGQHKTTGLTLIAPAQNGHLRLIFQQTDEVFHMGGLAGAADGDITDGDDRRAERPAFQDAHLEEQVSETDAQAVEPTEWQQLFVNADEVALDSVLT